ncbi:MAG: EAL domain-containing protein [Marmoricola sp.]|nr:EAL domain-containing protein [Marmoricola sp.]
MAGRSSDATDRAVLEELAEAVRVALDSEVVVVVVREGGRPVVHAVAGDPSQAPSPGTPVDHLDLPVTRTLEDAGGAGLGTVGAGWGRRPPPADAERVLSGFAVALARLLEQTELAGRAMTDPLTGVGNRTQILERLRHATTARPESGVMMGLAFVDLDHFKSVNDEHSHEMGDQALAAVATRIQAAVRAHDTVARWGGDEFLVLLNPVLDEHAALGVVHRILDAVTSRRSEDAPGVPVTASIGVAFWSPGTGVDSVELVRRADEAMYDAKQRGRNQVAIYDALDPAAARRLHLRELLDRAPEEQRTVVQYQPIVAVADGRLVGVEALLRLRDDDGSLVYPSELLRGGTVPAAVARAAMHTACRQVADWTRRGHDLSLSLNVSAPQVADPDGFARDVETALADSGLDPARLTLELTEHALLSTTGGTLAELERLVDRGVRLSIDDFGTGYGSLTYVHTLPVHELKVDRSFVQAFRRPAASAVVRSVVGLAADLGLRCVAEGVEDLAEHEFLCSVGAPLAQGHYYSDALDADGLGALLRAGESLLP